MGACGWISLTGTSTSSFIQWLDVNGCVTKGIQHVLPLISRLYSTKSGVENWRHWTTFVCKMAVKTLRHFGPCRWTVQYFNSKCLYFGTTTLQPFNGLFSRTTWVSRYQIGKTNLDLLEQETVSGSGISWAICKSASRSRQITVPVPHHSNFLQAGCPSYHPPNSVKALKAKKLLQNEHNENFSINYNQLS